MFASQIIKKNENIAGHFAYALSIPGAAPEYLMISHWNHALHRLELHALIPVNASAYASLFAVTQQHDLYKHNHNHNHNHGTINNLVRTKVRGPIRRLNTQQYGTAHQ